MSVIVRPYHKRYPHCPQGFPQKQASFYGFCASYAQPGETSSKTPNTSLTIRDEGNPADVKRISKIFRDE
jgi:hypothetical protein